MDQFGVPFWTGPEHLCGVGHLLSSIELMVTGIWPLGYGPLVPWTWWPDYLPKGVKIGSQNGVKIGQNRDPDPEI